MNESVIACALVLHQLPRVIWNDIDYEDVVDALRIYARMNGATSADGAGEVIEADELDLELVRELKERASKKE